MTMLIYLYANSKWKLSDNEPEPDMLISLQAIRVLTQ